MSATRITAKPLANCSVLKNFFFIILRTCTNSLAEALVRHAHRRQSPRTCSDDWMQAHVTFPNGPKYHSVESGLVSHALFAMQRGSCQDGAIGDN